VINEEAERIEYFVTFCKPHVVVRWDRNTHTVDQYISGKWVRREESDWLRELLGYDSSLRQVPPPVDTNQIQELLNYGNRAPYVLTYRLSLG
jgi:hypothetical protein